MVTLFPFTTGPRSTTLRTPLMSTSETMWLRSRTREKEKVKVKKKKKMEKKSYQLNSS